MPKSDIRIVIDTPPNVHNGEMASAATVVQVSQLAMSSPFSGDFQIVDNGRLIVGENIDFGDRVVVGKFGLFGYDPSGINTFAVLSKQHGQFGAGDVFAGYAAGNHLLFRQADGTLGLYSPAGAGFIAAADGSLWAGDTDGAHMHWSQTRRALEVRNGEDIKISLDANGDALFDGVVRAAGGRIYGAMQVDGLLRAGDVDGPSISLGRFERLNESNVLVESSEIVATDAANLPWFRVVAGGGTPGGGWFQVGNPGDYQQRMTYDGERLSLDGDIYARGGEIISLDVTGTLTFGGGNMMDNEGIKLLAGGGVGAQFQNSVSWVDPANEAIAVARMYADQTGDNTFYMALNKQTASGDVFPELYVSSDGSDALGARATFQALGDTKIARIVASVTPGGNSSVITVSETLAFYGASPVACQLLPTGAGKTVDNVISALQALGLVRQS